MKKLLLVLLAAFALPLHGASVTAEGRAAGDLPNAREIALADALREAFLTTDAHFMRSSSSQAGSTAVVALVTRTYVIVANAGDSRCMLWREGTLIATLMTCLACKCSPWRGWRLARRALARRARAAPLRRS